LSNQNEVVVVAPLVPSGDGGGEMPRRVVSWQLALNEFVQEQTHVLAVKN
jgi:hypothetical protein